MKGKISVVVAIAATAWLGVALPASADQAPRYGEHAGSVVFAETLADAAKLVGHERARAPHANVDIRRAQFTQTDGRLTLDLELRHLRGGTVDRLVVNFDTDGDARPDQRLRWDAVGQHARLAEILRAATATTGPSTHPVDCTSPAVELDYGLDRVRIVVDRDCLPVVEEPQPPDARADSVVDVAPMVHANVEHLQAMVYDHLRGKDVSGLVVHAKWDFLGGRDSMVAVPF